MEEKVFFNGKLGKVCGVLHLVGNKNEVVIIVHGFSTNKEIGAKINSERLNEIGLNALRIDLDNQGESDLDFKTEANVPNYIKQVEASIEFIKTRNFKEISLLGTSFGGLVVLATTLNHPEIKRLFLRAPVFEDHRSPVEIAEYYSMVKHANEIKQPIMIVQGNADKEVDYKIAQEIVNLFPNAKLKIIEGADHGLGIKGDYTEGAEIMKKFFLKKI